MKIALIARCKNEMNNLKEWLINKNFCNLIFITDNESTDGSFEFLKKQENVVVTPVKGFDEGRDFQILLSKAREHKVDWVFKFDCDEFVGEDFETQLNYVLNQTDYDCIRMKKCQNTTKLQKKNVFYQENIIMEEFMVYAYRLKLISQTEEYMLGLFIFIKNL